MPSIIDDSIAEQKIKSISANIAAPFGVPEITVCAWMEKLFSIVREFYITYGSRQFVLFLNNNSLSADKWQILDKALLWNYISKHCECFNVDIDLKITLSQCDKSDELDVAEYCYQHKVPALRITGEDSRLHNTEGRCVAFYNFVHPEVRTQIRTGLNARSYRDYKLVIEEQAPKQLIKKMDELWHDRNNRILIGNRKTEKLLQDFLFTWLSDNIHDARVVSEVGKISHVDRTDIELTSMHTGDNVIIEVKWMGMNASKTIYDIERLKEGIRQVCTYLEREPSALEGCVVCYDGRKNTEDFSLDKPIAKLEYRIVWLESRSGSQIGATGQ